MRRVIDDIAPKTKNQKNTMTRSCIKILSSLVNVTDTCVAIELTGHDWIFIWLEFKTKDFVRLLFVNWEDVGVVDALKT